jgi:hypothetical protein
MRSAYGWEARWLRAWFWSSLRPSENWAQTLVRVIGNLFRILLTALAALALGVGAQTWISQQRDTASAREAASISVDIDVWSADHDNGCSDKFPLAVSVTNSSAKALMRMDIVLIGREPGTSSNVLNYGDSKIAWDFIVPPGYNLGMCYGYPSSAFRTTSWDAGGRPLSTEIRSLSYSVNVERYSIELKRTEPWMIRETKARRIR